MGEWRYNSTILDLDTRWRLVVSFMHKPHFSRRKDPRYRLDSGIDRPPKACPDPVEYRKIFYYYRKSNPVRSVSSPSLYEVRCLAHSRRSKHYFPVI
jgi:hypothetical protein